MHVEKNLQGTRGHTRTNELLSKPPHFLVPFSSGLLLTVVKKHPRHTL